MGQSGRERGEPRPVWEPEPLPLPLDRPSPRGHGSRREHDDEHDAPGSDDDRIGTHVVVIDLA
jgi:hypothetical protein